MNNKPQRRPNKWGLPFLRQFSEGFFSFRRGVLANPYHPDSLEHREWQRGWDNSYAYNLGKMVRTPFDRSYNN